MSRLFVLLILAAAPFMANAHGGHHSGAAVQDDIVRDSIGASAPCAPGGGGEICSCHNLSCLPHFDPAAVLPAPVRACLPPAEFSSIGAPVARALPPAPFVRFSPRGPPLLS